MGTRKPLTVMFGTGALSCGAQIGFRPDPPEGGTAVTTPPAPPAGSPAGQSSGDPDVLTLTRGELQDRLTKLATKEKDQGMRSGAAEFARSLGFDSPDALGEIVRQHQDAQRKQMSEADRARAEADDLKAQAHQALVEAKQARFDAKAQAAVAAAGAADPELAAAALTRLGVTVDSSDEEIRAAVEKMRERNPGAFGQAAATPASDPGRPPTGSPGGSGSGNGQLGQQAKQQLDRRVNRRGGGLIA